MYNFLELMMKPHIEKEYKMMINKEIYEKLLFDYSVQPTLQTNYYYATGYKDKTARIRKINNTYLFTLKVSKNGYKEEYEFEVKENSLKDERIQKLFMDFHITNIEYQGFMDTYRSIVELENGEFCIDYSIYNQKEDYELEYELKDPDKDTFYIFEDLLKKYDLRYSPSTKSKYKRFLDSR